MLQYICGIIIKACNACSKCGMIIEACSACSICGTIIEACNASVYMWNDN